MKLKLNLQRRIQIQEVKNQKSKRNLKAKKAAEKKEVELEKDLKGAKRLYLSNSLPNLHTIGWITVVPEDKIRDEAEQALSDQYDRQVRDFYDEAKDQAKALREVYSENLISKLFEEK